MKEQIRKFKLWLIRTNRKRQARKHGVPFRDRMWYNYQAMLPEDIWTDKSFIEIFDNDGKYIVCPSVGGEVVYNDKGQRYMYRIIGFKNESRNRDWLYDSDYIHPVVEYLRKIED